MWKLQVEAVGEQVLVHDVEVVDAVGAVGFGFDVVAFGVEPVRAARDLGHGHSIHEADHELHGNILRGVAVASGEGFDSAVAIGGLGEADGGYIEGQAGGGALSLGGCGKDECDCYNEHAGEGFRFGESRDAGLHVCSPITSSDVDSAL